MLKTATKYVSLIIFGLIAKFGLWAVFVLMALESANIPIPSEVILTYAGFLVSRGELNFYLVVIASAVGCVMGGSVSYWLGSLLGRPFLMKYGRWILLSPDDIEFGERFLDKYGELTYFLSRMLPVVRTFIAFPVGIARGNFWRFNVYSFLGSLLWSWILVWLGVKLGDNWELVRPYWDKFSYLVVFGIIIIIVIHIIRVFRVKAK
jgi:membrane protein DedA with SNARE-associated domain